MHRVRPSNRRGSASVPWPEARARRVLQAGEGDHVDVGAAGEQIMDGGPVHAGALGQGDDGQTGASEDVPKSPSERSQLEETDRRARRWVPVWKARPYVDGTTESVRRPGHRTQPYYGRLGDPRIPVANTRSPGLTDVGASPQEEAAIDWWRPGQHLDRLGEVGVTSDRSVRVPISPNEIGEHLGVARIALRARSHVPVAIARRRERVDREHLIASSDERADEQAAVGLDRDQDIGRLLGMLSGAWPDPLTPSRGRPDAQRSRDSRAGPATSSLSQLGMPSWCSPLPSGCGD